MKAWNSKRVKTCSHYTRKTRVPRNYRKLFVLEVTVLPELARVYRTGDVICAWKFSLESSRAGEHGSLRCLCGSSTPRRNIVGKHVSILKHVLHISHFRRIPTPNVLIENVSLGKHVSHIFCWCRRPIPDVLIEWISSVSELVEVENWRPHTNILPRARLCLSCRADKGKEKRASLRARRATQNFSVQHFYR